MLESSFHRYSIYLSICLLLVIILATPSFAQTNQTLKSYVQQAQKAYKEKNYPVLIDNMKQALEVRPNYGLYTYHLAIGYALNGNQQEAFSWLNRLAEMGLVYNVAANEDFKSLRGTSEFTAIVDRFKRNAEPVGSSESAFSISEKGVVPEGLAYDPLSKTFFIGSVYKRKIISVNARGESKEFSSPADGLWSVMGMRVDAARRLLWVCTASHQQMINFKPEEKGQSGVFKYDLKTGKLLKKYVLPAGKEHWLGDLVLNTQGTVFTSDSVSPAIYFLNPKTDALELFLENEAFVNPQGLAFSAGDKQLFMADYLKGVFIIDPKRKTVSLLAPAEGTTMFGIDGLYSFHGELVGVQNGVNPNRIIRLSLNEKRSAVKKLAVLEANNKLFDEPTLGVLDGNAFYYIANSQWGMIDDKGKLAAEEKLKDPVILKLSLHEPN